jgi:hypothetical protein
MNCNADHPCQACREETARKLAGPSHLDVPTLLGRVYRERCGYFLESDIELLAKHPTGRLQPVLVRCGSRRFVCPAQDVAGMIAAVEAAGDYVRDCSIPA